MGNRMVSLHIRDRSETIVGGSDAESGPLKVMTLVWGSLKKKMSHHFQRKLSLHYVLFGAPIIFLAK